MPKLILGVVAAIYVMSGRARPGWAIAITVAAYAPCLINAAQLATIL